MASLDGMAVGGIQSYHTYERAYISSDEKERNLISIVLLKRGTVQMMYLLFCCIYVFYTE